MVRAYGAPLGRCACRSRAASCRSLVLWLDASSWAFYSVRGWHVLPLRPLYSGVWLMSLRAASVVLTALTLLSGVSCSSDSDKANTPTGPVGGAVTGPEDTHCEGQPDGVSDPAACFGATSDGDSEG